MQIEARFDEQSEPLSRTSSRNRFLASPGATAKWRETTYLPLIYFNCTFISFSFSLLPSAGEWHYLRYHQHFFLFLFLFFFEGFGSLRTIRIRLGRRVLRRDPPDNSVNDFAKMNKKKKLFAEPTTISIFAENVIRGFLFIYLFFFWVWWKGRKMIWIKRERHPEMFFFSCRSNSHSKVRSWPSENWIRRIRCNTGFIQIKGNALGRFYYGFSFWFRLHDSNVDGSNQNSFGVAPVQFLSVGLISKRPPESASIDRNGNQKENTHRFWREKLGEKKKTSKFTR